MSNSNINQDQWFGKVVKDWEKSETNDAIPYYVNHVSERTSWDHPYFVKILDEMHDVNNVKYAAYRTALKLRHLQKRLLLHNVTLTTLTTLLNRHGYSNGCDAVLSIADLSTFISNLYTTSDLHSDTSGSPLTVDVLSQLLLNLILNLYDVKRSGCVRVQCVKICLVVFCNAKLSEKYSFMFRFLVGSSYFLSQQVMAAFLQDVLQITELLGERGAFSSESVSSAVNSCFSLGSSGNGVTEDMFHRWLMQEPQTLVWLPTMHRVAASESVSHDAKCNICKMCPIIGFRYRCLKCFHFDLCQQCFFSGKQTKKHKLKHPVQEYCTTMSSRDDAKAIVKTLKNKLRGRRVVQSSPNYLPIDTQPHTALRDRGRMSLADPDPHSVVLKAAERLEQMHIDGTDRPRAESVSKSLQTSMIVSTDSKGLQTSLNIASPADKESRGPNETDRFATNKLLAVIDNLQSENRQLQRALQTLHGRGSSASGTDGDGMLSQFAKCRSYIMTVRGKMQLQRALETLRRRGSSASGTDGDSIISYTEELEDKQDVLEARNEVLREYNLSLSRQLVRVQDRVKSTPPTRPPPEGTVPVAMTPITDNQFAVVTPITTNSLPLFDTDELRTRYNTNIPGGLESTPCAKPWTDRLQTDDTNSPLFNHKCHQERFHNKNRENQTFANETSYKSPPPLDESSKHAKITGDDPTFSTFPDESCSPNHWRSIDLMDTTVWTSGDATNQSYGSEEARLNQMVANMDDVFNQILSQTEPYNSPRIGVNTEMLAATRALGDAMQSQFTSLFNRCFLSRLGYSRPTLFNSVRARELVVLHSWSLCLW